MLQILAQVKQIACKAREGLELLRRACLQTERACVALLQISGLVESQADLAGLVEVPGTV